MRRVRASIGDGMFAVLLVAVDLAVLRALVFRPGPQADNDPIESWAALVPLANAAAILGYDRARHGPDRFRRVAGSLLVVGGILYGPYGPVLLVAPFAGGPPLERLALVAAAPGFLAGFLPGLVLFHRHLPHELPLAGLAAACLLVGLTTLGAAGGRRLVAAGVLAGLVTIPTVVIAYLLLRA